MAIIKPAAVIREGASRVRFGGNPAVSGTTVTQRRNRFYNTIRFRLTMWYAAVMVGIVIMIGVMVSTYVQQGMSADMEERLQQAAEQINNATQAEVQVPGRVFTGTVDDTPQLAEFILQPPEIANLVLSGIWVAYTNKDGTQSFKDSSQVSLSDNASRSGDSNTADSSLDASPSGVFPGALFDQVDTTSTLLDGTQVFQTIDSGDLHARVLVYPIIRVDNTTSVPVTQIIGSIIVGTSLEQMRATMDLVNQVLLLIGVGGVVAALFFGWLVAGRSLSPVQRITNTAQEITRDTNSAGSLSIRLDEPKTGDELDVLANTFNDMLSRIEDSFNAQRRFVADASHELRTPLTAIRGNVDVLLLQAKAGRTVPSDVLNEALSDVQNESARMARLIQDLLTLARSDASQVMESVHPEVVSLDVLANEAYRTLEPLANGRNLVLRASEPVAISGDGDRLVQVMIILGENALRHTPEGGTVILEVDRLEATAVDPACARVTVRDTGVGIAREHLPHLFERFYRVADSRGRDSGGTGLGLSIALGIVRAHGGWIDVESGENMGSCFMVYLPLQGYGAMSLSA